MAQGRLLRHIEALLSPTVYHHPVERVELIQTHISYVFLAGEYIESFGSRETVGGNWQENLDQTD